MNRFATKYARFDYNIYNLKKYRVNRFCTHTFLLYRFCDVNDHLTQNKNVTKYQNKIGKNFTDLPSNLRTFLQKKAAFYAQCRVPLFRRDIQTHLILFLICSINNPSSASIFACLLYEVFDGLTFAPDMQDCKLLQSVDRVFCLFEV